MRTIDPQTVPTSEVHRYLLSCVAPRPIAFVGTTDGAGQVNLSPFSFFNAFGANPPTVAFSPAFRGTDGSSKHTYENVLATGEFTVSVVSWGIVEQMNLASADWPRDVDEFEAAGFTKAPSQLITPPGVAESPMFMECRLQQHVSLGTGPASGNLLIGEVVMFHIKESVFDGKYPSIDRLDLVARMGGPYYCRASGDAVFSLAKPAGLGIGYNRLPESVRTSSVLSANNIAQLATFPAIPSADQVAAFIARLRTESEGRVVDDLDAELRGKNPEQLLIAWSVVNDGDARTPEALRFSEQVAAVLLDHRRVEEAWFVLLGGVVPES